MIAIIYYFLISINYLIWLNKIRHREEIGDSYYKIRWYRLFKCLSYNNVKTWVQFREEWNHITIVHLLRSSFEIAKPIMLFHFKWSFVNHESELGFKYQMCFANISLVLMHLRPSYTLCLYRNKTIYKKNTHNRNFHQNYCEILNLCFLKLTGTYFS